MNSQVALRYENEYVNEYYYEPPAVVNVPFHLRQGQPPHRFHLLYFLIALLAIGVYAMSSYYASPAKNVFGIPVPEKYGDEETNDFTCVINSVKVPLELIEKNHRLRRQLEAYREKCARLQERVKQISLGLHVSRAEAEDLKIENRALDARMTAMTAMMNDFKDSACVLSADAMEWEEELERRLDE